VTDEFRCRCALIAAIRATAGGTNVLRLARVRGIRDSNAASRVDGSADSELVAQD
jgi:hypothetical protein